MLSFSVVVVVEIDNLSSLLPGADFRKKEREVWMGRAKII
jgi:hypothetical protein